jgi:hypothetical protein
LVRRSRGFHFVDHRSRPRRRGDRAALSGPDHPRRGTDRSRVPRRPWRLFDLQGARTPNDLLTVSEVSRLGRAPDHGSTDRWSRLAVRRTICPDKRARTSRTLAHKRATRLLGARSRVGTVYQQTGVNMEVWVGVLVAVIEVVVIVGVGSWLAQRRRRGRTLSERGRGGVSARWSRNYSPTDLSDEHARS